MHLINKQYTSLQHFYDKNIFFPVLNNFLQILLINFYVSGSLMLSSDNSLDFHAKILSPPVGFVKDLKSSSNIKLFCDSSSLKKLIYQLNNLN